ncbi:MAG: hypothetical protein JF886_09415 [Candidatus Dormibacteraeota bacterium]|uniref:Tim44-like domain-containing protein n=1 Tax=Candidatus Aeolococcus gillhamiae TaxID=3127015 RepID=A0A934JSV1_9BACT|nr:hypothetical protein [Candidatus Dormibacteraeota bacterium]
MAIVILLSVAGLAFLVGRAAAAPVAAGPTGAAVPSPSATPGQSVEGGHVVDGVPLGYTDDQRGAVAAATAFATALSGPLALTPDAYRRAVTAMAAPNAVAHLAEAADQQTTFLDSSAHLPSLAAAGVPVTLRCVALSYQVEALTALNASVRVWSVTFMAAGGHLVTTAVWATIEYRLLWVGSDWRLERSQVIDVGWAPASVQPTPATSDMPGQLHEYREYLGG